MSLLRSYPNQFSANITTTSTGSGSTGFLLSTGAADFGFNAALLKMIVNGAGPAYIQFNGNPATTNDYQLSTGDTLTDWYDIGAGASTLSIGSTSTGFSMRLGAWG